MYEKVKCPICKQRLFDIKKDDVAEIQIKCSRCGKIVTITTKKESYRARVP